MTNKLDNLINQLAQTHYPSDILVRANYPIFSRKNLKLGSHTDDVIDQQSILAYLEKHICPKKFSAYNAGDDINFRSLYSKTNMRINAFHTHSGPALAIRIPHGTLPIQKTNIPQQFIELFSRKSGLIIISGATGSGKSTCIASIIQHLSTQINRHMLTIEDPIEYFFQDDQIIFSQREVHEHVDSMLAGIESGLRQDPDMILIGEIRTLDEISAAVTAAETGHLVITTLHANGFVNVIQRIVDVFMKEKQQQVIHQLSQILLGVASLQLIHDQNNVAKLASEITLCNDAIKNIIRSQKLEQANTYIQSGKAFGMRTLSDHIKTIQSNKLP